MKKIFLFTLALFGICSCSEGIVDDYAAESSNPSVAIGEVVVDVGANSISRAAVSEDYKVTWSDNDELIGWFATSGIGYKFAMEGVVAGDGSATFKGQTETSGYMRLIYPYSDDSVSKDGCVINLATQSVDMQSDALAHYGLNSLYMMSDKIDVENIGESASMKHLFALVELVITPQSGGLATPHKVTKAVIKGLNNKATISFEDAALASVAGDITIAVANATSILNEGDELRIPFSAIPFTTAEGEDVTIDLYFGSGNPQTITKSITSGNGNVGKEFAAGTHNTISCTVEEIIYAESIELSVDEGKTYETTLDAGTFDIDDTITLKALLDGGSSNATDQSYSWSISGNDTGVVSWDPTDSQDLSLTATGTGTVTITVTANGSENKATKATCTFTVQGPIAVGDYLYADKSYSSTFDEEKTLLGVVYLVDEGGKSGRIVAVNAGFVSYATSNSTALSMLDIDDGLANMKSALTAEGDFTHYPAFTHCHSLNDSNTTYESGSTDVWYIPAENELIALFNIVMEEKYYNDDAEKDIDNIAEADVTLINTRVSGAGGDLFIVDSNGDIHASNLASGNTSNARYVRYKKKSYTATVAGTGKVDKDKYVRPIMLFDLDE